MQDTGAAVEAVASETGEDTREILTVDLSTYGISNWNHHSLSSVCARLGLGCRTIAHVSTDVINFFSHEMLTHLSNDF